MNRILTRSAHESGGTLTRVLGVLVMLSFWSTACPVRAEGESLPENVSIAQLLKLARERSPRYALTRNRMEAAVANVVAAGVLPNPRLNYGRYDLVSRRNTMFDGSVQEEYSVEIPLLVAGQRGVRVEAAERQAEATEAGVRAEFSGLVHDVWRLFARLLAEQERVKALEETHSDLARLKTIVGGRADAGNASHYDVLRITLETETLESRLEDARINAVSTAGEIGTLLGLSHWRPHASGNLAPLGVNVNKDALWQTAQENHPELEAARREEVAAEAGMSRARRERWPVPLVLLGTAFTDRPYGMTTFAGVSVDLPLFDRGQGGMAKAAAEQHAAALQRELVYARTRQELERSIEVLTGRRQTLERYEKEVLQPLPQLKEMAESAYRLGKSNLLELLDASRSRTDIRLNHLDLLLSEVEAEIEALNASGILVATLEQAR